MPRPLTPQEVRRIRDLRYGDGLTQEETARVTGRHYLTVCKYAPGYPGKVPNDKLRAAFLASGRTASDVARELGWWDDTHPDTSRVRRWLGLQCDISGRTGARSTRTLIDAETASLMAEAIGVMPWEILPDDEEEAA